MTENVMEEWGNPLVLFLVGVIVIIFVVVIIFGIQPDVIIDFFKGLAPK